jgi:deoxyxylulose-5-phosphate synthase
MKIGLTLCLVGMLPMVSACASITQGTRDALLLRTDPEGASAMTSNGYSCAETPCAIEVPKKQGFTVTFEKDGCQPKSVNVITRMSKSGGAAVAGNVLVGGIIDSATGAAKELVPNPVEAKLSC